MNKFLRDKYGLKENPFLDTIASEKWLDSWVNRDEELEIWNKIIKSLIIPTKNYIAFIIGEYGRGKTLSLFKIIDDASAHEEILPVFLNFRGEQKTKNPGLDFILRIFSRIPFDKISRSINNNTLMKALASIPNELDEVKNVLEKIIFGDANVKKRSFYFLSGQIKPSKSDFEALNVIRKIDDIEIAKEYLLGILIFLKAIGFSSLLLAIDEFEYLFSLVPKTQRTIYIALLRGLFDFPVGMDTEISDITKMALFIAISEDGWRQLQDMQKEEMSKGGPIQPLLRRIDAKITLKPLSRRETQELVELRLRTDRTNREKFNRKPLIPFTDDFVKFVFEHSNGELYKIIQICSHVLDAGLEKGVTLLNKKFAEDIVKERDL